MNALINLKDPILFCPFMPFILFIKQENFTFFAEPETNITMYSKFNITSKQYATAVFFPAKHKVLTMMFAIYSITYCVKNPNRTMTIIKFGLLHTISFVTVLSRTKSQTLAMLKLHASIMQQNSKLNISKTQQ